jgi:hypothetical protein
LYAAVFRRAAGADGRDGVVAAVPSPSRLAPDRAMVSFASVTVSPDQQMKRGVAA